MQFTQAELREIVDAAAKKAAHEAVTSTFVNLGVDLTNPEDIKRFRSNLDYLSTLHEGTTLVRTTVIRSLVGLFCTGLATLLVLGYRSFFSSH